MSTLPKRSLGQHFLVDRNVLGVIERLASLDREDVVLEIGPGRGVLTTYVADRVGHLHAIELDGGLENDLRGALAGRPNVTLVFGDALRIPLDALVPAPAKLVANLPYNVATPLVVETLLGVPGLQSWCVMVQREVADRLFAAPGSKAYGGVSVMVRLHARRTGFHPVPRTVFRPIPNVDSALVAFERIDAPSDAPAVRRLVLAAFAHRRKTLANSLVLTGIATRGQVVAALEAIGRPGGIRAEALEPHEFVTLVEALRR